MDPPVVPETPMLKPMAKRRRLFQDGVPAFGHSCEKVMEKQQVDDIDADLDPATIAADFEYEVLCQQEETRFMLEDLFKVSCLTETNCFRILENCFVPDDGTLTSASMLSGLKCQHVTAHRNEAIQLEQAKKMDLEFAKNLD